MSSPSASPPKSKWMRAVRRASSVLVPTTTSRPTTPSADRDSDTTSLKRVPSITSIFAPKPVASHPSPIAESPARENAALQDAIPAVEPSPLAQAPVTVSAAPDATQATVTASPGPEPVAPSQEITQAPVTSPEPAAAIPVPDITQTSPHDYSPPPLIDSAAVTGPGAFIDGVDELPQPHTIVEPSREPSILQADSTDGHAPHLGGHLADSPLSLSASLPVTPPPENAQAQTGGSYFDGIPVHEEPLSLEDEFVAAAPKLNVATEEDVFGPLEEPNSPQLTRISTPEPQPSDLPDSEPQLIPTQPATPEPVGVILPPVKTQQIPTQPPAPQPGDLPDSEPQLIPTQPATPEPALVILPPKPQEIPAAPAVLPFPLPAPSFEYHPGQDVWGGDVVNGNATTRSRSSSIRCVLVG
ncbi:hypothetical protein DXG03_001817 [Asterophora parasitica]|uniref:Uncharacterized protein n=1 Tax=Asterophora parasitica TaxID=117018 RepID=A0A9P7G318_9AGAR|nr:hypothetical protein DXG03_001817 [Asterophora parasitica]